jgi:hypothetical protein
MRRRVPSPIRISVPSRLNDTVAGFILRIEILDSGFFTAVTIFCLRVLSSFSEATPLRERRDT